ncbi:bifunctional oligoribonuclease/PAP phosphatase NrnA [Granulicella sp. 5B5]|uniref:DHH family phosphoesterase n=1 Tax=Granulicella sp. 5B5 TaxID=1617967 RepID=UPI0015F5A415|nr:bifunctional oligoribonuclease/PAP phosphatase NrnA [Granulicella sp. 5B5]QMV18208.1 bifunctional oligoribonuclease/PAP phosphatase NrnA [Granulicella sp. 5B5]
MTNEESIRALLNLISERNTFLITSHARPDGDAIGSSVGLMHLLEAMGKRVTVAFSDPIPEQFQCLDGVERIVHNLPAELPDAAILLECDSIQRTGFTSIPAAYTINIDHHLSGRNYADFNWIDPRACAVGAMVYDVAIAAKVPISTAMSDCLYTAVLTDTGSFNYPGTSASTFALAGHLIQCGTDANRIAQAMYFSNPPGKVRLLGAALSKMHIKGEVCWSVISQDDLALAGATAEDCEGVVNHLISMAGIEAAILLRQQENLDEYRLSLRSKGIGKLDVSRVAEHFGGGGHRTASGCTLRGTAASIVERLLHYLDALLNDPASQTHTGRPVNSPGRSSTLLA